MIDTLKSSAFLGKLYEGKFEEENENKEALMALVTEKINKLCFRILYKSQGGEIKMKCK